MAKSGYFTIRPAGRHLETIGFKLIQDKYAAIIELVKNAYDADSPDVNIVFEVPNNENYLLIKIDDNGHGMTRNTVLNKWLVPSTDDKENRRLSPLGRIMQGRKGIGRYAASILGYDLTLQTISEDSEKTTVYLNWKDFNQAKFLDDIKIEVKSEKTSLSSGTSLTIRAKKEDIEDWNEKQLRNLEFELRKLVSPLPIDETIDAVDDFDISIQFINFPNQQNIKKTIKPYPVVDFFDYRIEGSISKNGKGNIVYTNSKAKNFHKEDIEINLDEKTNCGTLTFDIRVYDREAVSIDQLIKRGLKHDDGSYMGRREARQLLNKYNGIGVYRNGFRIRPLGDPEFDWLALNKRRIQIPSRCIGSDQVIGYIHIESEELSGLEEKSARDGLKDNIHFKRLKEIFLSKVLVELETRRFIYRKKAGLSRNVVKIEQELEELFSFKEIKHTIRAKLEKSGVSKKVVNDVIETITRDEVDKSKMIEDIKEAVAIYQGQATLGKIINVILHEGRKPLNYFKNQIPNLNFWSDELVKDFNEDVLNEILPIAKGVGENADIFVKLFSRLDPLAKGKRGKGRVFSLKKIIEGAFKVFENELIEKNISYEIICDENILFKGWEQDLYVIFTNLIDNSIYWISQNKTKQRKIIIEMISNENALLYIDYRDSGPGIEIDFINSGVIFEPEFSTKPHGTGLGLAIAGEAANRNNLELKVYDCDTGAYFRIQYIMEE